MSRMRDYFTITCPKAPSSDPSVVLAMSHQHRRAVERFAYYFRREFDYDFVQYESGEGPSWDGSSVPTEDEPAAYLLRDSMHPSVYVGAACFRWRVGLLSVGWALAWIWLHPYARCRGIATQAWPRWRERHGAFHVEPPLSDAMRGFLSRLEPTVGAR